MQFSWLTLIGANFALQWLGFALAFALNTERFYDALGTSGFLMCTAFSFLTNDGWSSPRAVLTSGMVAMWALRLGSFLVYRITKDGHDKRFVQIKASFVRFLVAWTLQAVWILATALPAYAVAAQGGRTQLDDVDYGLAAVWAVAFVLQFVADMQKLTFRSDPANKGSFITTGLWSWSQHPNYAAEMLMWWTLAALAARGLEGAWVLAAAGPVIETLLLLRVSGIPMLDKAAEKKWGELPAFRKYRDETALLIPFVY